MSKVRVGIVRFPGTNCDRDTWKAVEETGHTPIWLWHKDLFDVGEVDRIIVAGGFSYGDYLRTGALAGLSPVMKSVREASEKGVPVLGVCNGFQILCETGLLPGVLVQNDGRRFVDEWVSLEVNTPGKIWGSQIPKKAHLRLPIAHGEGRFFAEEGTLNHLFDKEQVWLTYEGNPNGSFQDIAGITNEKGNVAGLMPHPERAMHAWMGGSDGKNFFQ